MPRGGKREGSGRPAAVSYLEALRIAAEVDSRKREIQDANLAEAIAKKTGFTAEEWGRAETVPRSKQEREAFLIGPYLDDVEAGRKADQGTPEGCTAFRLLQIEVKRPKDTSDAIIRKVAAEESQKPGVKITEHMIKHWRTELHDLEAQNQEIRKEIRKAKLGKKD